MCVSSCISNKFLEVFLFSVNLKLVLQDVYVLIVVKPTTVRLKQKKKTSSPQEIMLCSLCTDFKGLSLRQLILWERPRATGTVVGSILATALVFGIFQYTMVTFLCRILEITFAVVGVMAYQKWIDVNVEDIKKRTRGFISDMEPHVITVIEQLFRIITWEDTFFSLKVFLVSFAVAFFGNVFSDLVFMLVATLLVFAVPVAYVNNKSLVDPQLQRASQLVNQYINTKKPKTA